jgi:hypothetical protein
LVLANVRRRVEALPKVSDVMRRLRARPKAS